MSADERLHRAQAPLHKLLCVYAYVCVLECVCVRVLGHVTVPSISFLECSLKKNITKKIQAQSMEWCPFHYMHYRLRTKVQYKLDEHTGGVSKSF